MAKANYDHLNFVTPRRNQGQIVEISYAVDAEREQVVSRAVDASDGTTSFAVTALDNLVGEFEPWDREPKLRDNGLWDSVE